MTDNAVYEALSKEFGEDAIQRTRGADTRKGYDTTGYAYQYLVNRFNEVLGVDGWTYEWEILNVVTGDYKSGKSFYDITANVKISVDGVSRSMPGGHISSLYADALKGAITNGFKKCAAMFGVGRQAYEGSIDDDNVPLPEDHGTQRIVKDEKDYGRQKQLLAEIGDLLKPIRADAKETIKKMTFGDKTQTQIKNLGISALEHCKEVVISYIKQFNADEEAFWEAEAEHERTLKDAVPQ